MGSYNLVGTAPDQVPTNADLGSMAFQDKESVSVDKLSVDSFEKNPILSQGIPNAVPYLDDTKVVTTSSSLTFDGTTLCTESILAKTIASIGTFSWNSATASPASGNPGQVTNIHRKMRRCILNNTGDVVYYLDATNSNLKEDGSASNLTGADGQVMVEIPAFYSKREKVGTTTTWSISEIPLPGFELEPAFIKDGKFVENRYYGAYDGCYYENSSGTYKSGLNLDTLTVDTVNDKLSSVSGVYPANGITRATARTLASNRGAGWRQIDFWLVQAVQLLYLIEYQTFYTQNVLGTGNTNGSYIAGSSVQADSPHTIAGASNNLGNTSTTTITGNGVSAKPGTSFMSYRGIENWYGNAWNWVDGFNINNNQAYVSNSELIYADDTTTNYITLGTVMPSTNGYPNNHQDIDHAFLPASTGGSTSTYWTDYYWQNAGWRVAIFGGGANDAGDAGGFCWYLSHASSSRNRSICARLSF